MELPDNFHKTCATAQIVCGAVLASTVVLAVIVEILRRTGYSPSVPAETATLLRMVFYVIVLGELASLQVVRRILLARPQGQPVALARLQASSIVTSALCESIAIFGLVLYFIGGFYLDFYIFLAVGIALQIFYFPRQDTWKMCLEEQAP